MKKSLPFKNYSKNSELPSKKFSIKMSIFVLQRYLCYEYWAMCYKVVLMCYVSRPKNILLHFLTLFSRYLRNIPPIQPESHHFRRIIFIFKFHFEGEWVPGKKDNYFKRKKIQQGDHVYSFWKVNWRIDRANRLEKDERRFV